MVSRNQETLFMFKPDAISRNLWRAILFEIGSLPDVEIVAIKYVPLVTQEQLNAHYQEHLGKDFYHRLEEGMLNKPVIPVVLRGRRVVSRVRNLLGVTAPDKASLSTIRGRYCDDCYELSGLEDRMVRNIAHASSNPKAARREIKVWFTSQEIAGSTLISSR